MANILNNYDGLVFSATTIKDEVSEGANTAMRIGSMLIGIIDNVNTSLQGLAEKDAELLYETNSAKSMVYGLASQHETDLQSTTTTLEQIETRLTALESNRGTSHTLLHFEKIGSTSVLAQIRTSVASSYESIVYDLTTQSFLAKNSETLFYTQWRNSREYGDLNSDLHTIPHEGQFYISQNGGLYVGDGSQLVSIANGDELSNLEGRISTLENFSETKGQPLGLASLGADGKLANSQLPTSDAVTPFTRSANILAQPQAVGINMADGCEIVYNMLRNEFWVYDNNGGKYYTEWDSKDRFPQNQGKPIEGHLYYSTSEGNLYVATSQKLTRLAVVQDD